jgi:hypothetical protein
MSLNDPEVVRAQYATETRRSNPEDVEGATVRARSRLRIRMTVLVAERR